MKINMKFLALVLASSIYGVALFGVSNCNATSYPTSTATPLANDLSMNQYKLTDAGDIITKGPWVDVRAYASFSDAIDTIGASKKTIFIPNQQSVTANKTVPSNVTLQFLQGGSLNISAGVAVTINGHIEANLYQIFEGSGSVAFGNASVKEVYPQWWGAVGDGITNDKSAIQNALNVAAGVCAVHVPAGSYYLGDDYLSIPSNTVLKGDGWKSSKIKSGNTYAIYVTPGKSNVIVKDLYFDMTNNISSGENLRFLSSSNILVENIYLYNFKQFGITILGCTTAKVMNSIVDTGRDNDNSIHISDNVGIISNHVLVSGNICKGTGQNHDITVAKSKNVIVTGNVSEERDISIEGAEDVVVSNNKVKLGISAFGWSPYPEVRNLTISNNFIEQGNPTGIRISQLSNYRNVVISGNIIDSAVNDGIECTGAVQETVISNNVIRNAGWKGISIQYLTNGSVEGNTIINSADIGLLIGSTCSDVTVANNSIRGISLTFCIRVQGVTCNVIGNILSSSNQGILCDGNANYVNIIGNTIDTMSNQGILMGSVNNNSVISGNIFKNITGNIIQVDGGASVLIKNNEGFVTENSGTATFSGNGSNKVFNIAHGLVMTPTSAVVTAGSNNASQYNFYVTYDGTNITVTYRTAPVSGTNNVVLSWYAEKRF